MFPIQLEEICMSVLRIALQQVIADAVAARVSLTLSVLKANPARDLYQRLGILVESETEHEYCLRLEV
jgi:hypothetical protein